jgi:dCTP deaminase
MILSGDEIRRSLGTNIVIDPFDPSRLNPNSYNLTLHDELMTYEEVVLDLAGRTARGGCGFPRRGWSSRRRSCTWAAPSSGPRRTTSCR